MTKVQDYGWMATTYSAYRHYWKSREHTELVISRCGKVINVMWLTEAPWRLKCPTCEIMMSGQEQSNV